jgi:hypothetical protein
MNQQLEQLKTELREFIELSKTYMIMDKSIRNISPAMAECLLVAIDGIETSLVYAHFIEKTDIEALQRTIQQILNIWEASK